MGAHVCHSMSVEMREQLAGADFLFPLKSDVGAGTLTHEAISTDPEHFFEKYFYYLFILFIYILLFYYIFIIISVCMCMCVGMWVCRCVHLHTCA